MENLESFGQDSTFLQGLPNLAGHRKHEIDLVEFIPPHLGRLDFLPDVSNDRNSHSGDRTQRLRHPPDIVDVNQARPDRRDHVAERADRRGPLWVREKFSPGRHGGKPDLDVALRQFLRQRSYPRTHNQRMETAPREAIHYHQQFAFGAADLGDPMDE
jgi:hypothetical protein